MGKQTSQDRRIQSIKVLDGPTRLKHLDPENPERTTQSNAPELFELSVNLNH